MSHIISMKNTLHKMATLVAIFFLEEPHNLSGHLYVMLVFHFFFFSFFSISQFSHFNLTFQFLETKQTTKLEINHSQKLSPIHLVVRMGF